MRNNKFNGYDFKEKTDFSGLIPKLSKLLKKYTIGKVDKPVVSIFDYTAKGVDQMETISATLIAQKSDVKPVPPTPPTPPVPPTPGPDDPVVQPEITENTPEQDVIEENIVSELENATKTTTVTVDEGTVNNLTIPETVSVSSTVKGEFQNGATITTNSSKSLTIDNTSEEPIDISIISNNGASVYLKGKYNNIYLNGKSISASLSTYADVYGIIGIDDNVTTDVTLSINFVGEESGVKYLGINNLTINDGNTEVMGSPTIYAPNSTVTMNGKYTNVTATVSENTLILKAGFHALSLNVLKGKVIFYGVDIKDFADEIINEKIEYNPYTLEINNTNFNKLTSNSGVYNFAEDIDTNKGVVFGIIANGKYIYNLNNHEVKCGTKSSGSIFLRGSVNLTINGEGKLINNANSYGVWVSGKDCVLNVNGGDFEAYTHVLYAENGTINVYGGTFKMLGEPELDSKGHCKFMLNCLDKSYTEGTAKINVYGGKFYNYNPAESYSEPSGPVSFVAEGYHVVETIEDGVPVFEVVKD